MVAVPSVGVHQGLQTIGAGNAVVESTALGERHRGCVGSVLQLTAFDHKATHVNSQSHDAEHDADPEEDRENRGDCAMLVRVYSSQDPPLRWPMGTVAGRPAADKSHDVAKDQPVEPSE